MNESRQKARKPMPSSCHEIEPMLTAYVDETAAPGDRDAVEGHLSACPACRVRAEVERGARDLVRQRADRLAIRASGGLRARCIAAADALPPVIGSDAVVARGPGGPGAVRWWLPLSMAAAIVLAVGSVLWFTQRQQLEAAFAAQLVKDHQKCFMSAQPATELDAAAAEARLTTDYGWEMQVPASSPEHGLRLIDAKRCLYAGGAVAHLLYEHGGEELSLFIVPDARHAERALEIVGHDTLIWSDAVHTYALVGEQGQDQLTRVAAYMRGLD
jgi:anti-sigma factor RsiW